MPLRAFSVFVAAITEPWMRADGKGLNALTGIQCIRSHHQRQEAGTARPVLMPLRAFSVFVGMQFHPVLAGQGTVLMPLRAFSVFVVSETGQ